MRSYDDLIDRPHHVSRKRPQMPLYDRAAQFAPFAALTGYDEAIAETGRLTDDALQLDESEIQMLDRKLHLLASRPQEPVSVTWFVPDAYKQGGRYVTRTAAVRKLDTQAGMLLLDDGTPVPFDALIALEGACFSDFDPVDEEEP